MRILLDHCVDWRFGRALPGHETRSVQQEGWSALKNGELLRAAAARFDVMITTDKKLKHQQNLAELPLGVIVLICGSSRLADLLPLATRVLERLGDVRPGTLIEVHAQ